MKRLRFPIAGLMAAVVAVAINLCSDSINRSAFRTWFLAAASCRWQAC